MQGRILPGAFGGSACGPGNTSAWGSWPREPQQHNICCEAPSVWGSARRLQLWAQAVTPAAPGWARTCCPHLAVGLALPPLLPRRVSFQSPFPGRLGNRCILGGWGSLFQCVRKGLALPFLGQEGGSSHVTLRRVHLESCRPQRLSCSAAARGLHGRRSLVWRPCSMGMPGGETGNCPHGRDRLAGGGGLLFQLGALSPTDKLWGSDTKGGRQSD